MNRRIGERHAVLIGTVQGRLTVKAIEHRLQKNDHPAWYAICECSCGSEKSVLISNLKKISSCGCYRRECKRKHGQTHTKLYRRWQSMITRCIQPVHLAYKYYGGRGIEVCERWRTFENFVSDMGHPPEGMEIDRIDSNGNYEPSNCRWATRKDQMRNMARNRFVILNGVKMIHTDACIAMGLPSTTLAKRIHKGWTVERALNTPIKASHKS